MKTMRHEPIQRRTPHDDTRGRPSDKSATFKISSGAKRNRGDSESSAAPKRDNRTRLRVLAVIFVALGITVGVRLWYLQVLDSETFKEAAEQNQVRISRTQAPRGRVLGTDGSVLVDNRVSLSVGIELVQLRELTSDERSALLKRLSELLGVPVSEMEHNLEFPKVNPVDPIPVATDVPVEKLAVIKEHQEDFPAVVPVMQPVRVYPQQRECQPDAAPQEATEAAPAATNECGTLGAHVLGYVGETNDDDLAKHADYRLGDLIGRAGVEAMYEQHLRGEGGQRKLEVDSRGRMLRVLGEQQPVQGHDVQLAVDTRIQRATERALEAGINKARSQGENAPAGAAVVLDPRDGSVRAMASYPVYEPSDFTGGIPTDLWEQLNAKENHYPLNNRAVQGMYPAASTWKVVTGMAALDGGFIAPNDVLSTPYSFRPGSRSRAFKDWKPGGHGSADYRKSLVWSVDVYYYKVGFAMDKAGDEIMQKTARAAGFGEKTGIDLPVEKGGRVPDQNWKRSVHNQAPDAFPDPKWYPGDSLNLSIGQGDLLVTPLQMANVYAAIANGGTLWKPHLLDKVVARDGTVTHMAPPEEIGRIPMSADNIGRTMDALYGVTTEGTARGTFRGFPLDEFRVGGKTGTGQVFGKGNISWFVGVGTIDNPEYVIAVAVEEGGGGSQTAGPIARSIYETIYGIESKTLVDAEKTD